MHFTKIVHLDDLHSVWHVVTLLMSLYIASKPFTCSFMIRGSCMVWEINMGVCPRLDFENIMIFNCLGYNFNIYGAFEFLCNSIANLWRHKWYHYNTLGYPVIIISKVVDISCNGRRNVLLNSYFIDKFAIT